MTKDINKLGKLLNNRQRSEFKVESLRNPSFVQSRKAISKISQQAQVNDVVFFYYSGHGVLDQQQSLYLLFGDSETSFLDATCLESEFILSQFRKSACQNFIIIIDCCHSGAFFNNNRGLPKGLFALTACDEQGLSYEDEKGGIFTNIIINGLTSDYIDADRDGKITFSELFDYVIDEIKSNTAWRSGAPQKWEWNVNNRMRFIKEFFDDDVKTLIEHIKSLRIKKVKSENT